MEEDGQPQEEVFTGTIDELVAHSNWKARKQGATQLTAAIEAGQIQEYGGRVKDIMKDSNASVLEVALECAAKYFAATGKEAQGLDTILSASAEKGLTGRAKSAQLGQEVFAVALEQGNAAEILAALSAVLVKARAPKHKQAYSACAERLVREFGVTPFDDRELGTFAARCLAEKDDKTKKSGRAVCAIMHQTKVGDGVYSILAGQKAVALKPGDIEEVKKVVEASEPPAAPTRFVKGAAPVAAPAAAAGGTKADAASLAYEYASPELVLKHLPKDFWSRWIDPALKFPERESMFTETLLPRISKTRLDPAENYHEPAAALKRTLTDSNAGVISMTLKVIQWLSKGLRQNFAPYGRILFPVVIDLLKVKTRAVATNTETVLDLFFEHSIVHPSEHADTCLAAADNKVPMARVMSLQWIGRCMSESCPPEKAAKALKLFGACIAKNVEHSDSSCRSAAADAAVRCVTLLGQEHCKFLQALPAAVRDKVLKQAGDGSAMAIDRPQRPGTSPPRGASSRADPKLAKGASMRTTRSRRPGATGADSPTPPPASAAPAAAAVPAGARDLRHAITPEIMAKLQDEEWRKRDEGLTAVQALIRGSRVKPDVGSELIAVLKARVQDRHKNVVPQACDTVADLARSLEANAARCAPELVPVLLVLLGDQKVTVRTSARAAVDAFAGAASVSVLLPHYPKAMQTEVSVARQALCEIIVPVLEEQGGKLPRGALADLIKPLVAFLQDRMASNRHLAEALLRHVIDNVGYEAVQRHVGSLQPSNQRALQPILDKNRLGCRSDDSKAAAADSRQQQARKPHVHGRGSATSCAHHADAEDLDPGSFGTPVLPRRQSKSPRLGSVQSALEILSSGRGVDDPRCGAADEAARVLTRALEEDNQDIPADDAVDFALRRLDCVFSDPEMPLLAVSPATGLLVALFTRNAAARVSADTLFSLIGDILTNLLTEKLHGNQFGEGKRGDSEVVLRQLNSLMLKVLEHSSRTACFEALMRRLDWYSGLSEEDDDYGRYVSLVVKCLMKLSHLIRVEPTKVNFTTLLREVHRFLQDNPPSKFKDKKSDMSLRTVKTVLNEFVKIKGEGVLADLAHIEGDTSLISGFVDMCLHRAQQEGGPDRQDGQRERVGAPRQQPAAQQPAMDEELSRALDDAFVRIRRTASAEAGFEDLVALLREHPQLDIQHWLGRCSRPFQNYVLRTLKNAGLDTSSHDVGEKPSLLSSQTKTSGSIEDIRVRMQSIRQARRQS